MSRPRLTRLGVRVLGPLAFDGADIATLRSRKARRVLAVLALAEGLPVGSETLVDAVWGGEPPADPSRDLSVLVSRGRALLGADRLVRRSGGYALLADWWDRAECAALVRTAARRRDDGELAGAMAAAEAALGLVRGSLLADEADAPWAEAARAAAAVMVTAARQIAGEAALLAGQIGEATVQARLVLDHDPYDEAAARLLMRAQAAGGRPASALVTYARLADRLAEELGVDPADETRAVHEQILRAEPTGRPLADHSSRREPALIGRQHELARLDALLGTSRGGARVVVVLGEPGAGKSALIAAWAREARERGVTVLASRAEDGSLALQPVIDALSGRLGTMPGNSAPPRRGLPGPIASADAIQRQLFADVDEALTALSEAGPTALLIDDLEAADPKTFAWLGHVLRRAGDHRFLVVAASHDFDLTLPATVERLLLEPLDLAAVTALVGSDRAADLHARTGGNALLVTELARSSEALPATIRAAVAQRLADLGEAAVTLRTAAVLGPRIDLDLLAGVLDAPPLVVLEHLDEGVRRAFLTEKDATLEFRHELVRAAVSADTTSTRRTWIHRQAARLLTGRAGVTPLELVRHARLGGDVTALVTGLLAAAELARERLDLASAEAFLTDALAAQGGPELQLRRARMRMARGDLAGADADAQAAMAGDTTGEALELRAWAARNRHDMDAAIRLGTAGAAVATDDATKASCLVAVAFAHRGRGELETTAGLLREAAQLRPPPELGLSAWTGVLRVHQGRPLDALNHLEPLLGADADRGLQGFWVEHILQMTAHAYGLVGRPADALAVLDRLGLEIDRRGTVVRYAGVTDTYRSWILRNLGVPGATDLARSGLERAGSVEIRAQCYLDLADGLLRDGDAAAAAAHLDRADSAARARWFHNQWRFDSRLGILRARVALAAGEDEMAARHANRVRCAAAERGDRRYRAISGVVEATALARAGRRYDVADVGRELALLPEVAALESWWLAAELAAATRSAAQAAMIRAQATTWVDRLILDAGEYGDTLRKAARHRLG